MKSYGVTIQMKTIKQYSPVVLFIILNKVVLRFPDLAIGRLLPEKKNDVIPLSL